MSLKQVFLSQQPALGNRTGYENFILMTGIASQPAASSPWVLILLLQNAPAAPSFGELFLGQPPPVRFTAWPMTGVGTRPPTQGAGRQLLLASKLGHLPGTAPTRWEPWMELLAPDFGQT